MLGFTRNYDKLFVFLYFIYCHYFQMCIRLNAKRGSFKFLSINRLVTKLFNRRLIVYGKPPRKVIALNVYNISTFYQVPETVWENQRQSISHGSRDWCLPVTSTQLEIESCGIYWIMPKSNKIVLN